MIDGAAKRIWLGVSKSWVSLPMPSTSTPIKRGKATRLLASSSSKISVTLIDALAPLLFLRLAWKSLLREPTTTLLVPLLPSIFIIQSAFVILLLPFNPSPRSAKKRVVKIHTLGEVLRAKATVDSFHYAKV